jgi:hypothetical protein
VCFLGLQRFGVMLGDGEQAQGGTARFARAGSGLRGQLLKHATSMGLPGGLARDLSKGSGAWNRLNFQAMILIQKSVKIAPLRPAQIHDHCPKSGIILASGDKSACSVNVLKS